VETDKNMLQHPHQLNSLRAALCAGLLLTAVSAGESSLYTSAAAFAKPGTGLQSQTEELNPFTHVAYIPAGADLRTLRFEGARLVQRPVKVRRTVNPNCGDHGFSEPGGSAPCAHTQTVSRTQAWEVTYSFDGPALSSDEYGNHHFTVQVYFRVDELPADAQQALSAKKQSRTEKAAYFATQTYRKPVKTVVIDEAKSSFCDGNFQDGAWKQTNPNCHDKVSYKTVNSESGYVTLTVDPVPARVRHAAVTPANLSMQFGGKNF
jgi:hypothetical protein